MRLAMAAVVVVLAACQPPPAIGLSGANFSVNDAVMFSITEGGETNTVVVFGKSTDLCADFESDVNFCNAETAPEVVGSIRSFASPNDGLLGWLLFKGTPKVGRATTSQSLLDTTTYGVTLTGDRTRRVIHGGGSINIDRYEPNESGDFKFTSKLSDGREFRGEISARWCAALDLERWRAQSPITYHSYSDGSTYAVGATCGYNNGSSGFCDSANKPSCSCTFDRDCEPSAEQVSSQQTCCPLRFD